MNMVHNTVIGPSTAMNMLHHTVIGPSAATVLLLSTVMLAIVASAAGLQLPAPAVPRAAPVARLRATTPWMATEEPRKGLWGPDREPPACC